MNKGALSRLQIDSSVTPVFHVNRNTTLSIILETVSALPHVSSW